MTGADEERWNAWYEQLEKPVYNVVYRWLWDAAESQDVVQDAFLRCWRIRHRIEDATFKALLFRTALRLASNRLRRRRLWRFVPLPDPDTDNDGAEPRDSSSDTPDELAHRALRSALEELPITLRRVLLLSELGGLSYGEIAGIMKIREGTVGSRRSRAIAELRRRLAARGVEWNED
jgi:RNA polymerase sigma-70 factor (ECF subfamily)